MRALLLAVALLAPCAAFGQSAVPVKLLPADQGWVARIQDALDRVTTLEARFRQTAPDGKVTTGTATLERPGHMRFDYDAPSPLLLVADEGKVVFQDRDLGQVTTIPADRTPLGLLLRAHLALSGDVTVTGFDHAGGVLRLTLERTDSPGEGALTLVFADSPLALLGWVVVDAQGRVTRIDLTDLKQGVAVKPGLFALPKAEE